MPVSFVIQDGNAAFVAKDPVPESKLQPGHRLVIQERVPAVARARDIGHPAIKGASEYRLPRHILRQHRIDDRHIIRDARAAALERRHPVVVIRHVDIQAHTDLAQILQAFRRIDLPPDRRNHRDGDDHQDRNDRHCHEHLENGEGAGHGVKG